MKYSVAIRTLGLSGEKLRQELESLQRQTVKPSRVVLYIAEGYEEPPWRVADEVYVHVPKGMVAQAAVSYDECDTDLILKLDDDVEFTRNDDVERLLNALEDGDYDCVAADTFKNHLLPAKQKLMAAVTNLVLPHWSQKCAFKVRSNGSFSYIMRPRRDVYPSESAAGPCSLWRKEALTGLNLHEELWLDSLGYAFGDDQVIFQKLVHKGGKLAVLFNSGIVHNDAKTSSGRYHKNPDKLRLRAKALVLVWHRSVYEPRRTRRGRLWAACCFAAKAAWLLPVHCAAGAPGLYLRGLFDGLKAIKKTTKVK